MRLLFFALLFASSAWAEPVMKVHIMTFAGGSFWEATNSQLVPVGNTGRYISEKTEPIITGGNCHDLLQSFQESPLKAMKRDGYIDAQTYDKLMDFQKLGIQADQLTMISLFSDLTAAEVKTIFGAGGVPPERLMNGPGRSPGITRVNRGALYIVRGFQLEQGEGRNLRVAPRALPWELDAKLPNGLTRRVDRAKLPYVVEVGRAHSESKPLPGDFRLAVQMATAVLAADAVTLKVNPKKLMVTGHFLDPQHTRLFTKFFPLRILNQSVLHQLENQGEIADSYLNLALPATRDEWNKHDNSLTFGSLEQYLKSYPVEKISEPAFRIQSLSATPLQGAEAQAVVREFATNMREDYDFEISGFAKARAPLMIRDHGTPFLGHKMVSSFSRRGFEMMKPNFMEGMNYIGGLPRSTEPDLFMVHWFEKLQAFHLDPSKTYIPGIYLANLDPQLAEKMGAMYPAALILSVADMIDKKIEAFGPQHFAYFMQTVNEQRVKQKLPVSPSVDAAGFFDLYPIFISSENPKLISVLKELGAKTVPSQAMAANFQSGPSRKDLNSVEIGVGIKPTQLYAIDGKKLRQLRELYHVFNVEARQRLSRGVHDQRQKLLYSGTF